jgi:hypothetical protein
LSGAADTMSRNIRNKTLKDGFYMEVRNSASDQPVVIFRETEDEIATARLQYERIKTINMLGRVKNGKFVK